MGKIKKTSAPPFVCTTAGIAKVISTKMNPVTKSKTPTRGAMAETPMPILYKINFTKLPQWDFDDVYNQDAPPRPTVSIRAYERSNINAVPNFSVFGYRQH